jgi:outer membrane protein TolC
MESRYKNAVNRLCTLLGLWPGALTSELKTQIPTPTVTPDIDLGLPSDLLRQRPDILRAERNIAVTAAHLGVATADLYPRFSLNSAAGLASISARDFFSAGSLLWKIGPTLTWPILRRGQVVATIEVRNLQQQEALIEYRKTILIALEEADNAIDAYAKEKNRHVILVAALKDSNAALDMSRARYKGGLADFRDVLDAGNLKLQAKTELLHSDRDIALGLIGLYKALGGGWNAANFVAQKEGGFEPAVQCDAISAKGKQPCSSSP